MKVYSISYVEIQGEQVEWFSSKSIAEKRRKEVIENNKNNHGFIGCFKIMRYELEIKKDNIVNFLNENCRGNEIV